MDIQNLTVLPICKTILLIECLDFVEKTTNVNLTLLFDADPKYCSAFPLGDKEDGLPGLELMQNVFSEDFFTTPSSVHQRIYFCC